jgi:hypothetical protein
MSDFKEITTLTNTLNQNEFLTPSRFIISNNKKFILLLKNYSSLSCYYNVDYENDIIDNIFYDDFELDTDKFILYWSDHFSPICTTKVLLSDDGLLKLLNDDEIIMTYNEQSDNGPFKLILEDDGNINIYDSDNIMWSSDSTDRINEIYECLKSYVSIENITNTLNQNECLLPGRFIISNNKKFILVLQMNGNLVCHYNVNYENDITDNIFSENNNKSKFKAYCSNITWNKDIKKFFLSDLGVLKLIDNDNCVESINRDPYNGPFKLIIEDDGTLNLYNSDNDIIWDINSNFQINEIIKNLNI